MTERDPLVSSLHEGRRRFLDLVSDIRPDLHRYCARMVGSVTDGEDIVQEALARAYYALSELDEIPPLRPWLFQIAHHRAVDHLRRYERRMGQSLDRIAETAADGGADPESKLAENEATRAAISRFAELVPIQRSSVILKDVLGHSLEEIGELLELSIPSVKAALHRGRERLRELAESEANEPSVDVPIGEDILRYVTLFNARDWDGVRAMLAEDVRLDLVSYVKRAGRRQVSSYFTNYASFPDWRLAPAILGGRAVIAVFKKSDSPLPDYFIELTARDGSITLIRDYRYVPYIAADASMKICSEVSPRDRMTNE